MFNLPPFDIAAYRDCFASQGRVVIPNFLGSAQTLELFEHLRGRTDWVEVLNAQDKVYEISSDARKSMTEKHENNLTLSVTAAARHGFQFRYNSIRVPDEPGSRKNSDPLSQFVQFMSAFDTLKILSDIIGDEDIDFADGQATSYGPGHFLTRHDDNVSGKNRRAAYVLSLTPDWRAEWGGLLMFHDKDDVEAVFTPALGALHIFSVPMMHSVSFVTPSVPYPRLSITGWLRGSSEQ